MSKNAQDQVKKSLWMGFGVAVGMTVFVPLLVKAMSMLNVRL